MRVRLTRRSRRVQAEDRAVADVRKVLRNAEKARRTLQTMSGTPPGLLDEYAELLRHVASRMRDLETRTFSRGADALDRAVFEQLKDEVQDALFR